MVSIDTIRDTIGEIIYEPSYAQHETLKSLAHMITDKVTALINKTRSPIIKRNRDVWKSFLSKRYKKTGPRTLSDLRKCAKETMGRSRAYHKYSALIHHCKLCNELSYYENLLDYFKEFLFEFDDLIGGYVINHIVSMIHVTKRLMLDAAVEAGLFCGKFDQ